MHHQISLPSEVAGIRLPDSALARKAVDLAFRVSPNTVCTHVIRTFVFGSLIGKAQGLHYDEELFFLGAILHDLGLTSEFRSTIRFEVAGADAAEAFLAAEGVAPERREIIWDAIALHTSIDIASRKRPEIALVHIGAGVDVLGMGLESLPASRVAETIEAFPRHDFKNAFFDTLVETLAHAPQSATMTWLSETANTHVHSGCCPSFECLVKNSPFQE
ncbi:MAG: hypothetical protein VR75_14650 [Hyphomonadaceae bacterium BRH_c29]|nr:MAG: hypothetical protein VR75_14650 [Hyphomonadaceae bacterium BRH_c29]